MSLLFRLSRNIIRILFPSAAARKNLRKLGMIVPTWQPLVTHKRNKLTKRYGALTEEDRNIIGKINNRISRSDTMFEGDVDKYFLVGLSGLRAIDLVLQQCRSATIATILDIPCGFGRVGRYLAASFPQAQIAACDLMAEGVDFCAKEFGMVPVYSKSNFDELNCGIKFDLIWCGSLVTHLDAKVIYSLFWCLRRHLTTNGIVVFTTHGEFVARRLEAGKEYGISKGAANRVIESYHAQGFAFANYVGQTSDEQYGFSITSPAWIRAQCARIEKWKEICFQPQGWDRHQDVFGFQGC